MTALTPWDHLLALVVFVAFPIYDYLSFPAFTARYWERGEPVKIRAYRETVVIWASFAVLLVVLWVSQGRSWSDLGFSPVSWAGLLIGVALGLGLLLAVSLQWRQLLRKDTGVADLMSSLGDLLAFTPRTSREERWFGLVSVNAGITEELLYRGFMIWYLEPRVGLPVAALVSVAAFTFAHAYQGARQLPSIALMSGAMVTLYLLSGTILVPIVFHILLDLVQGRALAKGLRTLDPRALRIAGDEPSAA